jgi:hypothetical protein
MKREEEVKNLISKWVEPFGCVVYWEKKNDYGYPVFKSKKEGKGTTSKPDLLIQRNGKNYFCETKSADHKSNVYDSLFQILKYTTTNYQHFIDGIEVIPDGYFVASEYSKEGHLFEPQFEMKIPRELFGEGRLYAINKGELPLTEYNMTEQFTRILWRGSRIYNVEQRIGVLVSDKLNNSIQNPVFLYKKSKWQGMEQWK